ncbi:MAG TPA: hypothetical protein VKB60_12145, partial [Terriglobales bacterium]|nr:hypothetical protein [Terriglobales bacterium]
MRTFLLTRGVLALFLIAIAVLVPEAQQTASTTKPNAGATTSEENRPLTALPYSPSLDPTSMDRSVDPCVDLYTYSCGGWM